MDIGTAISKPFSDVKTLIMGIILLIIPIINFLTIPGYLLRVASKVMNGDKALPKFDNFGELVVDSLKAIVTLFIHVIVYMIVALILAIIPIVGPILALIWMIVFSFIMISGVLTLAQTKSIGAAINIPELFKKAKSTQFIIAVIVALIISWIIYAIIGVIVIAIFGAALMPTMLTGAVITDPAQIMAMIGTLMGAGIIMYLLSSIVGFVLSVFAITLTAEAYK